MTLSPPESSPNPTATSPMAIAPVIVDRKDIDANIWIALLAAGVGTLGIYILLFPLRATYLGQLLFERGWTQPVAILFAIFVMAFTLLKALALLSQLASLRQGWVPMNFPLKSPTDASLAQLQHTLAQRRSLLPVRCARTLGAYMVGGSREAANEVVAEDSSAAAAASEASYTIPRVLVWAIPLLGFIGTVVGISQAVSGFSSFLQTAQEVDQIKEGIGGVTTGLAVAFDTTLVALILSVLVMIPLVIVERQESKLLLTIDGYINDYVLARLPMATPTASLTTSDLQETIQAVLREELPSPEALMEPAQATLEQLVNHLGRLAQALTSDRKQFLTTLEEQHHNQDQAFQQLLHEFQERSQVLVTELHRSQDDFSGHISNQTQALAQLLEQSSQTLQQRLELLASLNQALNALAETGSLQLVIHDLNQSLEQLQPVLKQLSQPRRVMLVEQNAE
ncbi:MotA/TolQ/ExbB proton channel family protein [Candidatus Synechococcus calcipolaris G9]|uniref:MotA/TolQ/ExbB proton channel family protein n=1 Tax=Candidatus Synechococcus calcipolaris G9 TaxID=1497997 RepID=A0ABT6EU76_9SYNE|nr:MotA/TolQ/ExbB proton channel family protein [Candidatus Synechococcus calcipolaris]MDG2989443.1 MotA/TolQ/ExbB proton channel family protein [Candidatus Synechococcus calcipolaris G9]